MTDDRVHPLLKRLGLALPILQAPMAGVATPELAAAVSNAGDWVVWAQVPARLKTHVG